MPLNRGRIRCKIDVSQSSPFVDVLTGSTPDFWRGEDVQFELAFYYGSALADLTEFDDLILMIKDASRDGAPLVSVTIHAADLNLTLTTAQWEAGTGEHCTVAISSAETNFDLGGADSVRYWLVLFATTTNVPPRLITLGGTHVNVLENGYTEAPTVTAGAAPTLPNGIVLRDQSGNPFLLTLHTAGGVTTINLAPES